MRSRLLFLSAAVARAWACRRRRAPAAEWSHGRGVSASSESRLRAREAGGERRDATPRLPSRGAGAAAPSVGLCPCPAVASCAVASGAGSCFHSQLTSCVCAACVSRVCFVCVGAAQPPYGPVDVGGPNFGSGANAFWPGTGSYSTFGLYANSNAEVLLPEPETLAACVLWERGRRGPKTRNPKPEIWNPKVNLKP